MILSNLEGHFRYLEPFSIPETVQDSDVVTTKQTINRKDV